MVAWTVSLGQWNQWIKTIIPYLPGPVVLELGHGPGHLQVALKQAGVHVLGFDESFQMSRQAYRRLQRSALQPDLVNGISQHMPFPNDSIDQVAATFPSEYILDSSTLQEVMRVLRPGSSAYILPMAWITGRTPLQRLAAWLFRITGESITWDDRYLDPARRVGFQAHSEKVILPSSTLLIITLTKPH
jgi:ubiquinone/menaquinone biosynthesis C-methylase UbiE